MIEHIKDGKHERHESDAVADYVASKHEDKQPYQFHEAIPAGMQDTIKSPIFFRESAPKPHWHLVTDGFGKFGFELTMRIPQHGENPDNWPDRVMQELFAYVSSTGSVFTPDDFMEYGFELPEGNRFVGALFVADEQLKEFDAPSGKVIFLQVFPLTAAELEKVQGDDFQEFIKRVREATGGAFLFEYDRAEIA